MRTIRPASSSSRPDTTGLVAPGSQIHTNTDVGSEVIVNRSTSCAAMGSSASSGALARAVTLASGGIGIEKRHADDSGSLKQRAGGDTRVTTLDLGDGGMRHANPLGQLRPSSRVVAARIGSRPP